MEWTNAKEQLPTIPVGETSVKCMTIICAEGTEFVVKMNYQNLKASDHQVNFEPQWYLLNKKCPVIGLLHIGSTFSYTFDYIIFKIYYLYFSKRLLRSTYQKSLNFIKKVLAPG